jgi:hypothetical protein
MDIPLILLVAGGSTLFFIYQYRKIQDMST